MKTYAQQTMDICEKLDEPAQISLLKFARFLEADAFGGDDEWLPYSEAEMEEDIRLYDEAKAEEDGYRVSSEELRKKYGI